MRFVITGEWTRNSLLSLIVMFFLGYMALFWLSNAFLFFHKMSFSYSSVVGYYLGDEANYTQPRSYQSLLEVSHYHLFAMGILMLTLTHLLLFVPITPATKAWLICLSFGSAILDELSNWLIRFVDPIFAYLKLASFFALQASLLLVMVIVLHALITKMPSAYTDTDKTKKRPKTT